MANCQSCGKETGEGGICGACANTQNKQKAQPPNSSNKGRIIAIAVVIIVILAATFVIWGNEKENITGQIVDLAATSNTTARLTVGSFSPCPNHTDYKIILTPTTGTAIEYWFAAAPTTAIATMEATTGTAVHDDVAYGGNALNSGEYFDVTGLEPGMTYTISVYYHPTDSFYSLTGDTDLQMPP